MNNLCENRPATPESEESCVCKVTKMERLRAPRALDYDVGARIYIYTYPSREYNARITAHIISYVRG